MDRLRDLPPRLRPRALRPRPGSSCSTARGALTTSLERTCSCCRSTSSLPSHRRAAPRLAVLRSPRVARGLCPCYASASPPRGLSTRGLAGPAGFPVGQSSVLVVCGVYVWGPCASAGGAHGLEMGPLVASVRTGTPHEPLRRIGVPARRPSLAPEQHCCRLGPVWVVSRVRPDCPLGR